MIEVYSSPGGGHLLLAGPQGSFFIEKGSVTVLDIQMLQMGLGVQYHPNKTKQDEIDDWGKQLLYRIRSKK